MGRLPCLPPLPSGYGLCHLSPRIPLAIGINLAVLRCDWEELLPQRFLTVPRSAIQAETERLRRQLGL